MLPLQTSWAELFDAAGALPTQDMDWAVAALHAFGKEQEVLVASVESDAGLSAVVPLAQQRIGVVNYLTFLSLPQIHEPMDLLAGDHESLSLLLEQVIGLGWPVFFPRLDAGAQVMQLLRDKPPRHVTIYLREAPGCPVITLSEKWQQPEDCLSSHRRQDLRRAQRKAESYGDVKTSILCPQVAQMEGLLDEAFKIEAASWKGTAHTALLYDPSRAAFFREYARLAAARGRLRILLLHLGGQPAAMQIAVEFRQALWLLKIGYDAHFAACSPGQILMHDAIAYAARQQLKSFEFLGSIAPWTDAWTKEHRACASALIYPHTFRGAMGLVSKATGVLGKRLWQHPSQVAQRDFTSGS